MYQMKRFIHGDGCDGLPGPLSHHSRPPQCYYLQIAKRGSKL